MRRSLLREGRHGRHGAGVIATDDAQVNRWWLPTPPSGRAVSTAPMPPKQPRKHTGSDTTAMSRSLLMSVTAASPCAAHGRRLGHGGRRDSQGIVGQPRPDWPRLLAIAPTSATRSVSIHRPGAAARPLAPLRMRPRCRCSKHQVKAALAPRTCRNSPRKAAYADRDDRPQSPHRAVELREKRPSAEPICRCCWTRASRLGPGGSGRPSTCNRPSCMSLGQRTASRTPRPAQVAGGSREVAFEGSPPRRSTASRTPPPCTCSASAPGWTDGRRRPQILGQVKRDYRGRSHGRLARCCTSCFRTLSAPPSVCAARPSVSKTRLDRFRRDATGRDHRRARRQSRRRAGRGEAAKRRAGAPAAYEARASGSSIDLTTARGAGGEFASTAPPDRWKPRRLAGGSGCADRRGRGPSAIITADRVAR